MTAKKPPVGKDRMVADYRRSFSDKTAERAELKYDAILDRYSFPYFQPDGYAILDGDKPFVRYRNLNPNAEIKYQAPRGSELHPYFPPPQVAVEIFKCTFSVVATDATVPLVIMEGEKKLLALLELKMWGISIPGIDAFRSKKRHVTLLKELVEIVWRGRDVYIMYDNDPKPETRQETRRAAHALKKELELEGASVYIVNLPREGQDKVGPDDFIRAQGSIKAARAAVRKLLKAANDGTQPLQWNGAPQWLWSRHETPPPLPRGLLPKTLDDFAFGAPLVYDPTALGFSLLQMTSMATTDYFRVKLSESWFDSARLNTLLVGDSGIAKTPLVRKAQSPLVDVENERVMQFIGAKQTWDAQTQAYRRAKEKESAKEPGPEPIPPQRLYASDANPASASELLKAPHGTPHGLGIINEEMTTFLASMDDARNTKQAPDRGTLCKAYDGGPQNIERVNRGSVHCPNWSLKLFGAITTDSMERMFANSVADGLLARMSIVWVGRIEPNDSLDSGDPKLARTYDGLIQTLIKRRVETRTVVEAAEDAKDLFAVTKKRYQELALHDSERMPRYTERLPKLIGLVARIALLLMLIEACENPTKIEKISPGQEAIPDFAQQVTKNQMHRAIEIVEVLRQHSLIFYRRLEKSDSRPGVMLARHVARHVLVHRVHSFNQRQLSQHVGAWNVGKADKNIKVEALAYLEEMNWIQANDELWNQHYGIKYGTEFYVHPDVHTLWPDDARKMGEELQVTMKKIEADAARRRAERKAKG